MNYLAAFTPAELLFIKNPAMRDLREPLKLTLLDLMLKQVLSSETISKSAHDKDPLTTYHYITTGKNFQTHISQPHELFFTLPFLRTTGIKILFRHTVQMAFDGAKNCRNYFKVLFKGKVGGYAKHGGWRNLLNWYGLNMAGKELNRLVEQEITQLNNSVTSSGKNPDIIARHLKQINGNICLLPSVDFALLKEIDAHFAAFNNSGTYQAHWSSCGSWSTFDSACSSSGCSSGCSSSGCSSSGCSGCGGCGGGCS